MGKISNLSARKNFGKNVTFLCKKNVKKILYFSMSEKLIM